MLKLLLCALLVLGMPTVIGAPSIDDKDIDGGIIIEETENNEDETIPGENEDDYIAMPYGIICPDDDCWPF